MSLGHSDNEQFATEVHGVDTIGTGERSDRTLLSQVPVFDSFVPGASDEHGVATSVEHAHAFDGFIVGGNLGSSGVSRAEVHHASGFIGATADYFVSVLHELALVLSVAAGGVNLQVTNRHRGRGLESRTWLFQHYSRSAQFRRCGPFGPTTTQLGSWPWDGRQDRKCCPKEDP